MSRSTEGKFVPAPYVLQPELPPMRGLFLNAYPFWRHLHTYSAVDATTYTFDPNAVASVPLRRVIFSNGTPSLVNPVAVRRVANLHAKIFLCWRKGKLVTGFAGSWNLVTPTWLEAIAELPAAHLKTTLGWFEAIWDKADPYESTQTS